MSNIIQIKRGEGIPVDILKDGELGYSTNLKKIYIGLENGEVESIGIRLDENNIFSTSQTLANGKALLGKLTDGTTRGLISISAYNNVVIGDTSHADENVNIYGNLNLNHPLAITEGGTGAITAPEALVNLGAMASNNPTGTGVLSVKGTAVTVPQIQLFEDGATTYNARIRSNDDYVYFDGAQGYFFDHNLKSGKNIYSGGKGTLTDGKDGCFLGAGHIYIQEANPSIRFMLGSQTDADNPDARIYLSSNDNMMFEGASTTTFTSALYTDGVFGAGGKTSTGDGKVGAYFTSGGNLYLQGSSTPILNFFVGSTTSYTSRIYANSNDYLMFSGAQRYSFDAQLYSTTSTVATSDRNKKKDFKEFDERYENLFFDLKPQIYKFKDGTSDRFHTGFISQDVEDSILKNGLDSKDFAGYCKDIQRRIVSDTEDGIVEEEVFDENGNPVYDYMLRYEEFIALNTHMLQKAYAQIDEMKNTIELLQDEIVDLKAQLV